MTLPFLMSCLEPHARLYQLADGRFQIVGNGELAPLMTGYDYVLVEEDLAEYLIALNLPKLEMIAATIYEPWQKQEIRTHKQLLIQQQCSTEEIGDIDLDGERFLVMNREYVFVSGPLKERLAASPFKYLRFTEGLEGFAGAETPA